VFGKEKYSDEFPIRIAFRESVFSDSGIHWRSLPSDPHHVDRACSPP
jgi:hypothetical protein